jgi:microcystin-dependent protein
LFNAGDEGDAFKIDSSGNSHFYKEVNLDGNLTVSGVSNSFIPRGGIIMWSGVIIPESWSLCDGTNGTPDLRNRFIVSSGSSYNIHTSGGSTTRTLSVSNLPSHNHTGTTNDDGTHSHSQRLGDIDDLNFTSGGNQRPPGDGSGIKTTRYNIDSDDSSHQHEFTTNSTGSGTSFDIIPPYYALAFIMKL